MNELVISRFVWGDRTFAFTPPLVLNPVETDGLWTIDHPETGMIVFASTIEELGKEIASWIVFSWDNIAHAPDNTLASDALWLKSWFEVRCRMEKIS